MSFAMLHRDEIRPALAPLPGLAVAREDDAFIMATLQGRTMEEMQRRFADGHRAYVATIYGVPVAWGWVATRAATIGELQATLTLPAGERYLWNFVTRPTHRGMGIYPRLLAAILRAESRDAHRFWIAYAPENRASAAGIRKAGFRVVAEMSFDMAGQPAVRPLGDDVGVSRVLAMPIVEAPLAPCWKCIRAGKTVERACREGQCCCDYQQPEIACAS